MDPRVQAHADVLVDECADIEAGDNVYITGTPVAEDLVVAVMERLGERGAKPRVSLSSPRANRAYLRTSDGEYEVRDHSLAMATETDAVISIRGSTNTAATSDVAPEKQTRLQKANQDTHEALLDTKWVVTQYPASGDAQNAEMSTEAYQDFVWSAINKDWDEQAAFQRQLVDILDDTADIRIVSGDTTDVTMSIEGMSAVNDTTQNNMPGGEVFTAPHRESVEGDVLFDKPLIHQGREITDAYLRFEDGAVVDHHASKNEDVLTSVLDVDEGARYLGELGIGMNRDIDRFTSNMLFDEKMGDTVHMAIGRGYEENVPAEHDRNESAVHLDMIVDMSEDSRIEADGEVIQRNGTFVFEDGFET